MDDLTDEELDIIEARAAAATPGPWESFIEGRDHLAGDNFIRTGGLNDDAPDMYVTLWFGSVRCRRPQPTSTSSPQPARTCHG